MIYLFDDMDAFTSQDLTRGIEKVSTQRRMKALNFKFEKDRKLSVIAYLLLMYGLRNEYNIQGTPDFAYTETQKPYLINSPNVHFNISHCSKVAVCAIMSQPIGIDVEMMSSYTPELSEYVHNKEENRIIQSAPKPQEEFCRLWTAKEAILKIKGTGLVDNTKLLITNHPELFIHSEIYSQEGYAMSYALYNNRTISIKRIQKDNLFFTRG
jgi:4'-phosphopantetheinyl transferase